MSSEKPEDILRFFVRLEEIQNLGLVDDRNFFTRVMPLVSGSLTLLGVATLGEAVGQSARPSCLDEYFPYFVRETD